MVKPVLIAALLFGVSTLPAQAHDSESDVRDAAKKMNLSPEQTEQLVTTWKTGQAKNAADASTSQKLADADAELLRLAMNQDTPPIIKGYLLNYRLDWVTAQNNFQQGAASLKAMVQFSALIATQNQKIIDQNARLIALLESQQPKTVSKATAPR